MSLLEAILIGIIQGLTEFLPVSSSGHIELAKAIFKIKLEEGLLFTVVLHAATALSTVIIFWREIVQLFKGLLSFKWNSETIYCYKILITMIPAAVVGLLFEDKIESLFSENVLLVGLMLLLTGVILLLSDRVTNSDQEGVSTKNAAIMGLVQAIAILPGISRSGSTIATGVMMGLKRSVAARFSFIMVLPLIAGASAKKLMTFMSMPASESMELSVTILSAGFIAALVSGLFAIRWMIKLVENSQLKWFAYYCFLAGIASIIWSLSAA